MVVEEKMFCFVPGEKKEGEGWKLEVEIDSMSGIETVAGMLGEGVGC